MKTYLPPYALDRYPLLAGATRLLAGVVVVGTGTAATLDAGPGNYQALAEARKSPGGPALAQVTLPRVVIVARREVAFNAAVAHGPAPRDAGFRDSGAQAAAAEAADRFVHGVGSSRVDLQACKLEYSIVSPK